MPADQQIPAIEPLPEKKKSNRKLIVLLSLFFTALLAVLFFRSPISKISAVDISGQEAVSAERIRETAGISPGDSFFGFRAQTVEQRLLALPTLSKVQVRKTFPGKVFIEVEEHPRIAFRFTESGMRQAVFADGSVLDLPDPSVPTDKPILSGWGEGNPNWETLCRVLADIPDPLLADVSEIMPDPSVAFGDKIKLYTRSGYEVYTRISYLPDKLPYLAAIIAELQEIGSEAKVLRLMDTNRAEPPEDSAAGDN